MQPMSDVPRDQEERMSQTRFMIMKEPLAGFLAFILAAGAAIWMVHGQAMWSLLTLGVSFGLGALAYHQ